MSLSAKLAAMLLDRPFRNAVCRFMAVVVLSTQLAVSAFACPGPQAMSTVVMPGCPDMAGDAAGPSALCAAHCQQGQQSDQAQLPALPVVLLARLYTLPEPVEPGVPAQRFTAPHGAFAAADPPHAILHCCFRI
jgi:hypothetical protein